VPEGPLFETGKSAGKDGDQAGKTLQQQQSLENRDPGSQRGVWRAEKYRKEHRKEKVREPDEERPNTEHKQRKTNF